MDEKMNDNNKTDAENASVVEKGQEYSPDERNKLVTILLFGFFGFLILIGMFASALWGSYVSCSDGGGHLHYTVPLIEYQCVGFYIQDDFRLRGVSVFPGPEVNIDWPINVSNGSSQ